MEQEQRASLGLSSQEKDLIVQFLLQQCHAGVLPHGLFEEAAKRFKVCARTTIRLWKIAKQRMERGEPIVMKGKVSGYQHKDKLVLDEEKVRNLYMLERSSIRKLANNMEVSKSIVGRWVKSKQMRPHTSAIKLSLTQANKIARIRSCLTYIQPTIAQGKLLYYVMHNTVHIDEKWLYMTKATDQYYLLPDEDEPYRSCKSKRFITKVMFMCAVSRPHIGSDGQTIFDGKICIFRLTQQVPAQRKPKNRPKGTLETKPIQSVNKTVIIAWLINQIILTIKAKWPANATKEIYQ